MEDIGNTVELKRVFGLRVRQLRKKQRLTQEQLGRMVGINRTRISRLESGQGNATFDTIILLAVSLGIPPADLFADMGEHALAPREVTPSSLSQTEDEQLMLYRAIRL